MSVELKLEKEVPMEDVFYRIHIPIVQDLDIDGRGTIWIASNHTSPGVLCVNSKMDKELKSSWKAKLKLPNVWSVCVVGDKAYIGDARLEQISEHDRNTLKPTGKIIAQGLTPRKVQYFNGKLYVINAASNGDHDLYTANGHNEFVMEDIHDLCATGDRLIGLERKYHDGAHYSIVDLISGEKIELGNKKNEPCYGLSVSSRGHVCTVMGNDKKGYFLTVISPEDKPISKVKLRHLLSPFKFDKSDNLLGFACRNEGEVLVKYAVKLND
ncbi:hypothetical protein ACFL6I_28945 [candidate division KSB1 bacterium]